MNGAHHDWVTLQNKIALKISTLKAKRIPCCFIVSFVGQLGLVLVPSSLRDHAPEVASSGTVQAALGRGKRDGESQLSPETFAPKGSR